MKQAIAGVAPPREGETTIMVVWPTIAENAAGRLIGRLCGTGSGSSSFFTLGKLYALLSIPAALALFFWGLAPWICKRYRLTNRRLIVERGLSGTSEKWVRLEDFDAIDIEVLRGQEWHHAGEMIFRKGATETFRISGVRRPEVFKQTCLKAHQAYTSVERILALQSA